MMKRSKEFTDDESNKKLAISCQQKCSACCKKGKLFLTDKEFQSIKDWVVDNSPNDLEELEFRTDHQNGFHLYDQKDKCQFLNEQDLCRLHDQGVKPQECFWWPLHFYLNDNNVEIRSATYCCDAYKFINSQQVDKLEESIKDISPEIIKSFRKLHPGASQGILLKKL